MQTIPLGSTGRATTRLGFGCSSIMGVLNRRRSLALLESAFDAGIRHFDTAPMYGYGEAESCLGEFLSRHHSEVTVTTKFGIAQPASRGLVRTARAMLRPLIQHFPALKQFAARPKPHKTIQAAPTAPSLFSPESARVSLEDSLRALRVERIDVWLLHDVKPNDLASDPASDALLRFLEDSVREGRIGTFGVGTDRDHIPRLQSQHPEYCAVIQQEWSILHSLVPKMSPSTPSSFRIHHRALSQHFRALSTHLKSDSERCKRWSDAVGLDLSDSQSLADLMLRASYLLNPASILLFSSKRPNHIARNVCVADNAALDFPAHRLYDLVQSERSSLVL